MEKIIINIGRQLGSGGREIGKWLSEQLGLTYYDRELLRIAAEESGFSPEIFARSDEHKGFFKAALAGITPFFGHGSGAFYNDSLSEESLFRFQADAILKAAASGSCVFIGRCADYILRNEKACLNVFISADMADRIARVARYEKVDEATARRHIETGDAHRASYYNFYSSGTWGAASTYHLCLNSSVLGIEGTARFIKEFVERKIQGRTAEAGR